MRTRDFVDEAKAVEVGCDRQMIQKEMCAAESQEACPSECLSLIEMDDE